MKVDRSLRKELSNSDLAAESINLAETLYANDLGAWGSQTIQDNAIPTASPDLAALLPESSMFLHSYQDFEILNRYLMTRIFLLGLIQALATLTTLSATLDIPSVIAKGIQAASYIAMSSDYSLLSPSQPSLGAKILILPLQTSFGTWYRLKKREEGVGKRGRAMKRWVLEKYNATLRA
jgi:hypothetical protein